MLNMLMPFGGFESALGGGWQMVGGPSTTVIDPNTQAGDIVLVCLAWEGSSSVAGIFPTYPSTIPGIAVFSNPFTQWQQNGLNWRAQAQPGFFVAQNGAGGVTLSSIHGFNTAMCQTIRPPTPYSGVVQVRTSSSFRNANFGNEDRSVQPENAFPIVSTAGVRNDVRRGQFGIDGTDALRIYAQSPNDQAMAQVVLQLNADLGDIPTITTYRTGYTGTASFIEHRLNFIRV